MISHAPAEVVLQGVPGAPGRALGPVLRYQAPAASTGGETIAADQEAIVAEQARVSLALAAAHAELLALAEEVRATIGPEEAGIFEAQAAMSMDPILGESACEMVEQKLLGAGAAIVAAAEEQAAILEALDNEYLRERAADLRDVGRRAAGQARGETPAPGLSRLERSAIVVAHDIAPTETVRLDKKHVLGIALLQGGPTSHAAIVAKALGVPLVCGLGSFPDADGATVLLDGDNGQVVLYPGAGRLAEYSRWSAVRQQAITRRSGLRDLPAETVDGTRVRLVANAGSVAETEDAAEHGAEGIGLLRTEFLFLDNEPDEDEQFTAYSRIYTAMQGREVVVRTMDLGGDKPPPYLDFGNEANPFLGWRGLRVALDRPDMLRAQVRALLRAGVGRSVHLMFPMVSTLDEFRRARDVVRDVQQKLSSNGIPAADEVMTGIMVEVPAAALMVGAFAREADFFSIGTNDLTQYTMAADRGAARVAHLYSPVQPAVLRLIGMTVEAAHAEGRWVGICGEAAGNPAWAGLWLGMGIDELSMTAGAIPAIKEIICSMRLTEARDVAREALTATLLHEVEEVLHSAQAASLQKGSVKW
ncbi:MAG: phosphoenolpyruvate--protein phosphotransferase [Chloroflexota bacterium]|nr:phosphoenolpyruvate--protein phosphotransferase [Chloroflexota bacterium]